jgi:hypothetical protein
VPKVPKLNKSFDNLFGMEKAKDYSENGIETPWTQGKTTEKHGMTRAPTLARLLSGFVMAYGLK